MIRMFLEWRIERLTIEIAMLEKKGETLRYLQDRCDRTIHHDDIVLSTCDLAIATTKKDIIQAKLDNQ